MGSTALSQGFLVLAAPILTRLYSPDDFGRFALVVSLFSVAQTVVSLRYEMAIPLANDEVTAANLLALSLILVWFISGLLGLLVGKILPDFPPSWLFLGILGIGHYQALKYFWMRNQQFGFLSMTQMGQALAQVAWQIGWGLSVAGSMGLVGGLVVAQWVGVFMLWRPHQVKFRGASWAMVAYTYRQFPLYTLWASLLNVLGWQLPPWFLWSYFSPEVAGWYALTLRVLAMPSALIGQAVGQVFYPRAAQRLDKELVERVASFLLVLGFSLFAGVFLQGAFLFKVIFGAEWNMAGRYAEWLAPWLMLALASSPLSTLALIRSKQRQALWFTVYETSLRVGALWLGGYLGSPEMTVKLLALAGVIICTIYLGWVLHLAGSSGWRLVQRLQRVGSVGIPLVIGLWWVNDHYLSAWAAVSLSEVSLAIFGGWAWWQVARYENCLSSR